MQPTDKKPHHFFYFCISFIATINCVHWALTINLKSCRRLAGFRSIHGTPYWSAELEEDRCKFYVFLFFIVLNFIFSNPFCIVMSCKLSDSDVKLVHGYVVWYFVATEYVPPTPATRLTEASQHLSLHSEIHWPRSIGIVFISN